MTRAELYHRLYLIIGDREKVNEVVQLFGQLTPEPNSGNIFEFKRKQVPSYSPSQVRNVNKVKFTKDQHYNAKVILRKMGLI